MASLRFSIALTNKSSGDTIHKTNETEGSIVVPHFEEVHIENTNSCGYKCVMCPRESQTRSLGYMSLEDFSLVLTKVAPFDQTFHLHGFGEPLLDRKLPLKLQELKKRIPTSTASIFSTLGVRVKEDHFHELLHSGLDLLIISFYGFTKEEYQRVHGFDGFHLAKKNLKLLSEAKKQFPKFHAVFKVPASTLSPLALLETQEKLSICHWVKELGFEIREWTYLHNYSSGRSYNAPEPNKLCPVIH
ncbi:MAG TPA: radical SAM protein, partial [Chlamydiales bacterium]|nr:radical SAM protein [Chlamydiales bacterium]